MSTMESVKGMRLLFVDNAKKPQKVQETPPDTSNPAPKPPKQKGMKWGVFLEQCINSLIVGAIAGLSALAVAGPDAGGKTALIAFAMTALTELRKYRGI